MARILTALVLLPLLWWTVTRTTPEVFLGIILGAVTLGLWECFRMLSHCADGARPFVYLGMPAAWAVVLSFTDLLAIEHVTPLLAVTVASAIAAMWTRPDPRRMLQSTMFTVFGVMFVGLTLGHLVALRELVPHGQELLVQLFVCVILADTTAFYAGRALGKRRLAPRLSPKKSWEGAVAGVLASVAGAAGVRALMLPEQSVPHALAVGVAVGTAAVLGDLAESMVKRACGVKDSSGLLPGHGGTLDRMDSLLFAAPLMFYYGRWLL